MLLEKNDIISWLSQFNSNKICEYDFVELSSDYLSHHPEHQNYKEKGHRYLINCKDKIVLHQLECQRLPIQFGIVKSFCCEFNSLNSLEGSPFYVSEDFNCSFNQIVSLKYCPIHVGRDFVCSSNQLKNLQNIPKHIKKNFSCMNNQLDSLLYFPDRVDGNVFIKNNHALLKYNQGFIKNNDEFMMKTQFEFWQQIHFLEKKLKDNKDILESLLINQKIKNIQRFKI